MRRLMQWLVVLICLVVGLALHGRNHQEVRFDFYLGSLQLPLSVLLLGALAVGIALGVLAGLPGTWRARLRLRRLEAELRRLASAPAPTQSGEITRDP